MIQALQKQCEERRAALLTLLDNKQISLEEQHQIFGGIKELDSVITLVTQLRGETATNLVDADEYRLRKEWRDGYFTRFKRTLHR